MKKVKLLIVDDSEVSRIWLRKALPELVSVTAEIVEVSDGEQAVAMYKSMSPDLVFMDLTMPVMDGFEALEKIVKYDSEAKVVIVSADRQQSTKESVLHLGAKTILNKPLDVVKFKQVLLDNLFGD